MVGFEDGKGIGGGWRNTAAGTSMDNLVIAAAGDKAGNVDVSIEVEA